MSSNDQAPIDYKAVLRRESRDRNLDLAHYRKSTCIGRSLRWP